MDFLKIERKVMKSNIAKRKKHISALVFKACIVMYTFIFIISGKMKRMLTLCVEITSK